MANEQVRIDLTATDKASDKIDDVADKVEGLEKADPEIEITAADKASKMMGEIFADLDKLDAEKVEATVGIDDNATTAIADVKGDVEALTRADHELVLKARIDAARGELAGLRTDLEQTADKATDVDRRLDKIGHTQGPGLAGNAVSDLTGPLGEASSAASDIAGVFDGLGDIVGNVAGKMGADAEKMTAGIVGVGFAVTAAATAWSYFRQKQREAAEKQAELVKGQRDFNKAIAEGDRVAAATKFVDLYSDAFAAAREAGISVNDLTRYLTGQADAIPGVAQRLAELQRATEGGTGATDAQTTAARNALNAYDDLVGTVDDARSSYVKANGTIAEQDRNLRTVAGALKHTAQVTDEFATSQDRVEESTRRVNAALDTMRGNLDIDQAMNNFKRAVIDGMAEVGESALDQSDDVLALKQSVIDMGEQFGRTPLEIKTTLDEVDAGDLQQVAKDVEAWYKRYPIVLASKLDRPGQIAIGGSGGGGVGPTMAPTIGVLNMTLPAGWRGDPIRAAHTSRRRAGKYYART